MDPINFSTIREIITLINSGELCQFLNFCRWVSISIPSFPQLISPLEKILEKAYMKIGRRNKRSIIRIRSHSLSRGPGDKDFFTKFQDSMRNAVHLDHPINGNTNARIEIPERL